MGEINIGGVNRPVYGSEALAKTYFQARLGSAVWDAAATADRRKAHVTSTNAIRVFLDQQLGDAAPQPMPDPPVAPDNVQWATYEYALTLLGDATALEQVDAGSNIESVGAGSARVSFFKPTLGSSAPFPANVMRFLAAYLTEIGATVAGGGFASGTDTKSKIPTSNDFGLTHGFT